jgi:hypothetical protein
VANGYKHTAHCICPVCRPERRSANRRTSDKDLQMIKELISDLPEIEQRCKCSQCGSLLFCVTPHSCYCVRCGQRFELRILNLLVE